MIIELGKVTEETKTGSFGRLDSGPAGFNLQPQGAR
jgi:hypothetical protein